LYAQGVKVETSTKDNKLNGSTTASLALRHDVSLDFTVTDALTMKSSMTHSGLVDGRVLRS
jgi:hypothetical protein